MVERQLARRDIRDGRVLEAMYRVPRELFVPEKPRIVDLAPVALEHFGVAPPRSMGTARAPTRA